MAIIMAAYRNGIESGIRTIIMAWHRNSVSAAARKRRMSVMASSANNGNIISMAKYENNGISSDNIKISYQRHRR